MLINDPNQEPCRLAPLEAFSNELAPKELRQQLLPEREPNQIEVCSETVSRVFASRCAGDVKPATAAELYHAMQQKEPNEREDSVLCSWVMHATIDDLWWAWSGTRLQLADARPRNAARGAAVVGGVPVRQRARRAPGDGARRRVPGGVKMTPKPLQLPSPPGDLWEHIRSSLDEALGEVLDPGEQWALGGGTVLAAEWEHRATKDIDLKLEPGTREDRLEPEQNRHYLTTFEALGATEWHGMGNQLVVSFGETLVDLFESRSRPKGAQLTRSVNGRPERVLSSGQILAGKLTGRGLLSPHQGCLRLGGGAAGGPESA